MASSCLTTDNKNFLYLSIATLEEISRIFRILLESQIQPHNLPAAVKTCSTFKLGKEQSNVVIPKPPNVPNYEEFDVSLLYTLLRNLCPAFTPTNGWGSAPTNNDLCLGDDIERLRSLRNSVAHMKKPCIPNSDFKMQWTLLENICKRMESNITKIHSCGTPYLNGLNDILKRELGGDCLLYHQFLLEIRSQISELSEEFKAVLEICGPTEVWYGADAEMEIASECESNNIIYWRKKVGAIVHEIDRTTEKYQGSSNKKLIIRRVTREDEGGYQVIMQTKSCHKFIQSNQIDLKVLGNIPFVILSGAESVCFGNQSEISAAIKSDLPILEMNWGKLVDDQFVDFDVHIPKYKGSFLEDQKSKLVINGANFEDESIYCLAVRNVVGEGRSNPFVLRVTGSKPVITIGHITDLKARSLTIISSITTTENSPPVDSIHWTKNGSAIPVLEIPEKYQLLQDDKISLRILKISELDAGSYKCVAKNLVGSSESEIVQLDRPVISIEEETEGELTNTFRVKVVSIPSVFSVIWAKLVTTDPESDYIPIDLSDPIYSGTSCSTPFPKLVVNKSEASKQRMFKVFAENFIGQSEAIVGGQESISRQRELALKKQDNTLQFYEDGPSKIKFLRLTERIRKSLKESDLQLMKHHLLCLDLPGYVIEESAKIQNLLGFFSFLLSQNYFSSTDVVVMQLLLRCLERKDLEDMCIKYATEESRALCYYAESEKIENGFTRVKFHISKNINNYTWKYAEKLRETVAELVECSKDSIIFDGIRRSSSFNLVFQMKKEYVSKLINMQPKKLAILGRYGVDKIIVGQQTIPIDSNETCSYMWHSEYVYVGLCLKIGSPTEVRIRREVWETEEVVFKSVQILRGFESMRSDSYIEGFRLKYADVNVMFWPSNVNVICTLSQISLYPISRNTVIIMECDDLPPGFTRLKLMNPSNDATIDSYSVVMKNNVYISCTLFRECHMQVLIPGRVCDTSFYRHGPCSVDLFKNPSVDCVFCFQSYHWPTSALPWIQRCREHGWPDQYVVSDITGGGFHVVPVGSTPENELEWRISFSRAEKKLVYSMNHSQFLCYGLFQFFLKDITKSQPNTSILCSYFIKTIVFWVIQTNTSLSWTPENILNCFWACFKLLIHMVYTGECPNFFIPQNNMFRVKVVGSVQTSLFSQLYYLYCKGISCLLLSETIRSFLSSAMLNRTLRICTVESSFISSHKLDIIFFTELLSLHENIKSVEEFEAYMKQMHSMIRKRLSKYQTVSLQYITSGVLRNTAMYLQSRINRSQTRNKVFYRDYKGCELLKQSCKFGCLSDILYLAMYFYKTGRYEGSLSCLHKAQIRLSLPYVMYRGHVDVDVYKHYMEIHTLGTKLKRAVVRDIVLHSVYTYIDELVLEQEISRKHGLSILLIPPLVMLHMLFILNHHRLGDIVKSQQSLFDLKNLLLSDDGTHVPHLLRDISWQILGICQQLCGDYSGSLRSYRYSLQQEPFHKVQEAILFRINIDKKKSDRTFF